MAAFTTIAAGVGVASSLGGGLMSFGQAKAARSAARDARRKSEKLMRDARERAETNVYSKLNVRLDAFDEQYRQNLANQTQQIEALQEGDARALAGGIGKVAAAGTQATETTRIGMQQDLMELDKDKADAQEDVKQQLIAMDVGQAADQEKIRAEKDIEAKKAKTAGINQAITGVVGLGSMAAPMFSKNADGVRGKFGDMDEKQKTALLQYLQGGGAGFGG
jgi:paraquat-inducible protein B